jgi:hypothetical protein
MRCRLGWLPRSITDGLCLLGVALLLSQMAKLKWFWCDNSELLVRA